jgi:hypothetical protein
MEWDYAFRRPKMTVLRRLFCRLVLTLKRRKNGEIEPANRGCTGCYVRMGQAGVTILRTSSCSGRVKWKKPVF